MTVRGLSFSKEVRLMSVSAADKAMPDNSYKPYQAYLYYGDYPLARSIYALLNDPRSDFRGDLPLSSLPTGDSGLY